MARVSVYRGPWAPRVVSMQRSGARCGGKPLRFQVAVGPREVQPVVAARAAIAGVAHQGPRTWGRPVPSGRSQSAAVRGCRAPEVLRTPVRPPCGARPQCGRGVPRPRKGRPVGDVAFAWRGVVVPTALGAGGVRAARGPGRRASVCRCGGSHQNR